MLIVLLFWETGVGVFCSPNTTARAGHNKNLGGAVPRMRNQLNIFSLLRLRLDIVRLHISSRCQCSMLQMDHWQGCLVGADGRDSWLVHCGQRPHAHLPYWLTMVSGPLMHESHINCWHWSSSDQSCLVYFSKAHSYIWHRVVRSGAGIILHRPQRHLLGAFMHCIVRAPGMFQNNRCGVLHLGDCMETLHHTCHASLQTDQVSEWWVDRLNESLQPCEHLKDHVC